MARESPEMTSLWGIDSLLAFLRFATQQIEKTISFPHHTRQENTNTNTIVKEERENIFFLAHPRNYRYAIRKYNKCKIKQKKGEERKIKKCKSSLTLFSVPQNQTTLKMEISSEVL